MPRIKYTEAPSCYSEVRKDSFNTGEKNDCSVVAISLACNISYGEAHAICKKNGRADRKGMTTYEILSAVKEAGFEHKSIAIDSFIDKYPASHQILRNVTTHRPRRFNKVWNDGNTYLFFTRGHVLCVKDGQTLDHTRDRAHRVIQIHRVWKEA